MSSPAISTASDPEGMFLSSLALIDRIIAIVVRRHAIPASDFDDFAAWTKVRLIDDNYAVFRKFGGRSSLTTYLTAVIANLFRDYRNSRWGRWRPSAEAKRRGPLTIRLEELLYRDGHPVREAVQILRSCGASLTETELGRLAALLPLRHPGREVSLDNISETEASALEQHPPAADQSDVMRAVETTLRILVDELPAEDSLIMRMRFWSDISVADIARTLSLEQKPLYRRLEGIQGRLREALEERGIDRALAVEILSGEFS